MLLKRLVLATAGGLLLLAIVASPLISLPAVQHSATVVITADGPPGTAGDGNGRTRT
jgi:hypothetical protein